jgi:hypothetical protein
LPGCTNHIGQRHSSNQLVGLLQKDSESVGGSLFNLTPAGGDELLLRFQRKMRWWPERFEGAEIFRSSEKPA